MKPGKASWTAEITAVFRASETIRPIEDRLLHDDYAGLFVRRSFQWILKRMN
jgi:O-methyltransferase involved in polyketide biosynthesis